jgi:enamine deaminase RidA (YjgF/YER057c/UK114 family)
VIDRLNPPGLHTPPGYHHVNVAPAGRQVHLAGQCPVDPSGAVVGVGDLMAQVDKVAANIVTALAAVGLDPADAIRTVIYVVPTAPGDLRAVWRRLRESPAAAALESASTLLGVAQLAFPGQLLEVDVTAIGG